MKIKIVLLSSLILNNMSFAWEGHHLITYPAVIATNNNFYKKLIKVESLKDFLEDTKKSLPNELKQIETWAVNSQSGYKKLPKELAYDPSNESCKKNLVLCFKSAIRINWNVPLTPIIYDPQQLSNFPLISNLSKVIINEHISNSTNSIMKDQFKSVSVNEIVPIISVIAASSQEPDFGLDIGLYQNSNTSFGNLYNFGNQPIGDVGLSFTSQVLFHATSYQMPVLFSYFRPGIKSSYPQYRFYAYMHLARFARKTGHMYWSARFAGWGLHYLQDLTQPYHANLLLGFSNSQVVFAQIWALIDKKYINGIQNKIEERHIINENLLGALLSKNNHLFPYEKYQLNNFLKDIKYDELINECDIDDNYIMEEVIPQTIGISDEYSQGVMKVFPSNIVNNPNGINYTDIDYLQLYSRLSHQSQHILLSLYTEPLGYVAAYTRSCLNKLFLN